MSSNVAQQLPPQSPAPTPVPDRPRNLAPVHAVIPKECYENPTARGLLVFGRDVALWGMVVAAIALTDVWWQLTGLIILAGFIVCGLFVLGHDAAHGALFKSEKLNRRVGIWAMLPSLHAYTPWAYGHNRIHHGHTVRQQFDFVWHPLTVEDYRAMGPLKRLRTRLEWSLVGAGLYYGREIWFNRILRWESPDRLKSIVKKDRLYVYAFLAVVAAVTMTLGWLTYATWWGPLWMFAKVFVLPFMVFTHMIGWTVYVHHIHPTIRWWPRRDWNPYKGQMDGTTVWHVGPVLNFFWHNIFVHIPHHVDMRIPYYHLPRAADAIRAAFPDVREVPLSPLDYVRTTAACKLYDFEEGRWLPYAAADTRQGKVAHA